MVDKNLVIKKISILGVVANLLLLTLKILAGVMSRSQAMVADGIHSIGDVFSSVMSFIGAKLSSKPKDKEHPYGHGKAEYIFSLLIGLSMILASLIMINNSIKSIIDKSQIIFSDWLLVVCIISIIIKAILYLYCRVKYESTNSILIKANMEDHRNDIFLTVSTLISVMAGYYGMHFVDGFIGMAISSWILFVGIKLCIEAYKILMDTNIGQDMENEIFDFVDLKDEVVCVDSIDGRPIGQKFVIILKISMDSNITIRRAHNFSEKLKQEIIDRFVYVEDVIVHINPS